MPQSSDENKTLIGSSPRRREDPRLLTGRGSFADDIHPDTCLYAAIVRSPHAHAEIKHIDFSSARNMEGVVEILTGAELLADNLNPMPHNPDWVGPPDAVLRVPDGFNVYVTAHQILATDKVRYVGEPVAMVIAISAPLAETAAEAIDVDYKTLPAVTDSRAALENDAPLVWEDCANNLALTCQVGDAGATDRAFEAADFVVKLSDWSHRVTGAPMEPRSVVGDYNPATKTYILKANSGAGVIRSRDRLATVLNVDPDLCHVQFGDMGGNFGTRNAFFAEYALMPWAAKKVGQPVKWTATRTECFLTDYQARDLASDAELALDRDGNFLALRGRNILNLGAYTVFFWPLRKGLSLMQSVYHIPNVHFHGHAVLTHTVPTSVYRSAGRPEAIYMIERLIEIAARRHGFDRLELRRRNLISQADFPFTTAVGVTYDNGDYEEALNRASNAIDWAGFSARKQDSETRGKQRGIALSMYIEVTSGIPRERVELTLSPDGMIDFAVGTMSSGQGHETSFPQLLSQWLEIPMDRIRYVTNDSQKISVGGGTHSGRSMRLVSIALSTAIEDLLEKTRTIAAEALQADKDRLAYRDGAFHLDVGSSIDLRQIAEFANSTQGGSNPMQGIGDITDRTGGYPYGAHAAEVEVDPETGVVTIENWIGVDDVGRAVNPLILHGQAHGAVLQGIGQALLEEVIYEQGTGQLLTGSFMDYAMPRAQTLPHIETHIMEVPATSHPHGIRPGGEGGTTPAPAVVINAILDALDLETGLSMPATPERVWRAMHTNK